MGYYDQINQNRFVQYVAGIDRELTGLARSDDSLYLMMQYVDETNTATTQSQKSGIPDFRRVFHNYVLESLTYAFNSRKNVQIKIKGTYNFADHDWVVAPSLVWRRSRFEIEMGFDLLDGANGTFWGNYRNNDRMFWKMTMYY